MDTLRKDRISNYEKPEFIEIELAPQGVLCGSSDDVTIGVGGEQPDTED